MNMKHKRLRNSMIILGIFAVAIISVGLLSHPFQKQQKQAKTETTEALTASVEEHKPILTKASAVMEADLPTTSQKVYYGMIEGILDQYLKKSLPVFLQEEEGKNIIYSPVNTYMAMGMVAETTAGESRSQILKLLGVKDMETLRQNANQIWLATNRAEEGYNSQLANSIWLNNQMSYKEPTLKTIADNYYASTYQGEMGSEEYNQLLRTWINERTANLLEDQVAGLRFEPGTVMSIASTVYFQAEWAWEFDENNTKKQTFHGTKQDVITDFMNAEWIGTYHQGKQFSAVNKELKGGGDMWFILPNEDVDVQSLLSNQELLEFIATDEKEFIETETIIDFSVPKFDVDADMDLVEGLRTLGVTDIFDVKADFSPLTEQSKAIVSSIKHGTRVKIDEQGCTAAGYTVVMTFGCRPNPDKEIKFVADRPFIFVVNSGQGLPLFVGIVNQLG